MRVLGLSGSLRAGSYNTGLLHVAQNRMPQGAELAIYGGLREVPFYDADRDGDDASPAGIALREAIASADALLFAIPEYNGTIPAVVKNAVDWASRPAGSGAMRNKVSAVIGASPGQFGGIWAQDDLRKSLKIAGARVVDQGLAVAKIPDHVDDAGLLIGASWLAKLDEVIAALLSEAALSAK